MRIAGLPRFLLLTIALSWGVCGLGLAAERAGGASEAHVPLPLLLVAACAPGLAALPIERGDRLSALLARPPTGRTMIPAILLAALGAALAIGAGDARPALAGVWPMALVAPFGEELGWKGVLLPRLLARFGPARAALAAGLIHIGWHLPALLVPGVLAASGVGLLPWAIGSVALGFLMTAVFVRSGGNIWAAGVAPHLAVDWLGLAGLWSYSPAQVLLTVVLAATLWAAGWART